MGQVTIRVTNNKKVFSLRTRKIVNESNPKVLYDSLPLVKLIPMKSDQINQAGTYACPVYKTSERKGTLSTTGNQSSLIHFK